MEHHWHDMIISWLTINSDNIAEQHCRATDYFPDLGLVTKLSNEVKSLDIFAQGPVIFGASGLLNNNAAYMLYDALSYKKHPFIAWGIGANSHEVMSPIYPDWLKQFDLVGLRDKKVGDYDHVPCPTCMSSLFDKYRECKPDHSFVYYSHYGFPLEKNSYYPYRTNQGGASDFESVLQFLASGQNIITNSYHGMYWGCLLNRQVLAVNPFSSKFYAFPETVTIWKDCNEQYLKPQDHSHYLEDCRKANQVFLGKVKQLLHL